MEKAAPTFHSLTAKKLRRSENITFSAFKGKVVLIVNTASKCGYIDQLKGLQNLHEKYKARGFEVVALPSNDFKQEDLEGKVIGRFSSTPHT